MRKCVHFNGLMNKTCAAGCNYDEMDAGKKIPYRSALPCFKPDEEERKELEKHGIEQATCEHRRFMTEEEFAECLREKEAERAKLHLALAAVKPIREQYAGKNWSGTIECPACKGRLHVRHAASNGHIHARCETEGCISWME